MKSSPSQHATEHHSLPGNNSSSSNNNNNSNQNQQVVVLNRWIQSANRTLHQLTTKKYTLPDKIVASQILMYRQLLHTSCRSNLILSRPYDATPAQLSVQHMPWWETTTTTTTTISTTPDRVATTESSSTATIAMDGTDTDIDTDRPSTTPSIPTTTTTTTTTKTITMVDTGKMVISYDNLIQRLWNYGLTPYYDCNNNNNNNNSDDRATTAIPTFCIPHPIWVHRLGFQQPDPVTDFRSGGILSLALMVWIVEHCPNTYAKFIQPATKENQKTSHGDENDANDTTSTSTGRNQTDDRNHHHPASVLPFGITSINITDMISKLLLLSKKFDRLDALLSQKPFWSIFSDPYAILTVHELSIEILCIVVTEIVTIRQLQEEMDRHESSSSSTAADGGTLPIGTTAEEDILCSSSIGNNNADNPVSAPATGPSNTTDGTDPNIDYTKYISVFDFTHIMSITEERVEYDLLGSGPLTIDELRYTIYEQTLIPKYQQQLQHQIQKIRNSNNNNNATTSTTAAMTSKSDDIGAMIDLGNDADNARNTTTTDKRQPQHLHEKVLQHATSGIGNIFSSVAQINPFKNKSKSSVEDVPRTTPTRAPSSVPILNDLLSAFPEQQPHQQLNVNVVDLLDSNTNDDDAVGEYDNWMNGNSINNTNDHNNSNTTDDYLFGTSTTIPTATGNNSDMYDMFDAIDLNSPDNNNNNATDTKETIDGATTQAELFCITDD